MRSKPPVATKYSRQPLFESTMSPSAKAAVREATTWPTGAAVQHLAHLIRRGVGPRGVHAPAHVGVHRHEDVAHEDLAVRRLGDGCLDQREVVERGPALRTGRLYGPR